MIAVIGSETAVTGHYFLKTNLMSQEIIKNGLVGMEFKLGSQMNWMLTSIAPENIAQFSILTVRVALPKRSKIVKDPGP